MTVTFDFANLTAEEQQTYLDDVFAQIRADLREEAADTEDDDIRTALYKATQLSNDELEEWLADWTDEGIDAYFPFAAGRVLERMRIAKLLEAHGITNIDLSYPHVHIHE